MKMEYEAPNAEIVLCIADDVVLVSGIQEGNAGWVEQQADPFVGH